MNQTPSVPMFSRTFVIVSLLVVAFIMTGLFTSAVVFAATPNIVVAENMTVGDTGTNVVVLQALLSETGYLNVPINVPLGYFGSLTKNALARYQAATGVYPSVGYFGPTTKISMHEDYANHGWLPLLGW
jgi:hypothetical protein